VKDKASIEFDGIVYKVQTVIDPVVPPVTPPVVVPSELEARVKALEDATLKLEALYVDLDKYQTTLKTWLAQHPG